MTRGAIMVVALFMATTPVHSQSTPPAQTPGNTVGDIVDIVFKEAERRAIEDYYKTVPAAKSEDDVDRDKHGGKKDKDAKNNGRKGGLPPGLAKRDQLPPGLAKRGNRLPNGLMKGDLPAELESMLPPPPEDAERVIVDADVLLVQKGTDIILDVIKDVITNQ